MPINYKIIGKNMKMQRKQLHITQEKMATDLGLSTSLISKLERGVKSVSLDTFDSIAKYLGTNIARLLADPDNPAVAHQLMLQEITAMLDDLEPPHLEVLAQIIKTYMQQIQINYHFPPADKEDAKNDADKS